MIVTLEHPQVKNARAPTLTVNQTGDRLSIRGLFFQAVFDTNAGMMTVLDYGKGSLLKEPILPTVRFVSQTPVLRLKRVLRGIEGDNHCLTFFFKGSGIIGHLICHYQVRPDGEITIEAAVRTRKQLISFDMADEIMKDQSFSTGPIHKIMVRIQRPE
jgi:hypothetical protein